MREMTMSEMLKDPLVHQLLRADRISLATFAKLLGDAAKRQRGHVEGRAQPMHQLRPPEMPENAAHR